MLLGSFTVTPEPTQHQYIAVVVPLGWFATAACAAGSITIGFGSLFLLFGNSTVHKHCSTSLVAADMCSLATSWHLPMEFLVNSHANAGV